MIFEREGNKPVQAPTPARLQREISRLRTTGPSSFAVLQRDDGTYLQMAGSPGGLVLEKREAPSGQHFRAYQDQPVVPFEDGTELVFAASRIRLRAVEWFTLQQVVDIAVAFAAQRAEPEFVRWRDITDLLAV